MDDTIQETVEPLEVEADGVVYHVPSTFKYKGTQEDSDLFEHACGFGLQVCPLLMEADESSPTDPIEILKERWELEPEHYSKPLHLVTGYALMTYETPHEEVSTHSVRYEVDPMRWTGRAWVLAI